MAWYSVLLELFLDRKAPRSPRKNASARLELTELEPRRLLAGYHFDFGTEQSPVGSGYVGTPAAQYTSERGSGWTNASGVLEVVREEGSAVTRDFHGEKDRTFRIDVPNGVYLLTPTLGDSIMIRDHIDLYTNDVKVASDITILANHPYQPTYRVEATDGKLTLRLMDQGGQTVRWAIAALDVISATAAPVAAIHPDQVVEEGSEVQFRGTASGSSTLAYRWDFGDGGVATGSLTPIHTYADDGTYVVTLTVTDVNTTTAHASSSVIVNDVAPQVTLSGIPTSAKEGTSVTLSSSITDPSAADLAAGFVASWSVSKNGSPYGTASGKLTKFTFTPDDEGTYVVRLAVSDKDGTVSPTKSVTILAADTPLRPNALGPYQGMVGDPVYFVGIARDNGTLDSALGFSYAWTFGDGAAGSSPIPNHAYASPGVYTVTLRVTGRNGVPITTTTKATIVSASATAPTRDFDILSANVLSNTVYGNLQWKEMAASGAWGVNASWEQGTSSKWYIEQQRNGEQLILAGLLHNDSSAINAGFKMFDWGFQRQATDGSFAGTEDPFHSTSFFVAAVARACLVIEQSPYASQYQSKVDSYQGKVYKAAQWMSNSEVWSRGISNNSPYTHRRYLVSIALGLTSQLVGGDTRLMELARSQIQNGLAQQQSDGVNPEAGGYDSSYQAVGITYAQLWTTYFPNDSLTPAVESMIDKGLQWEHSRILASGEMNTVGNTRTGLETGPSGTIKTINWRSVITAVACQFQSKKTMGWQADARQVAAYYFKAY